MKSFSSYFCFSIVLIFSFLLYSVISFGIKDADEHLLIFFIKEKKNNIINELLSEEDYLNKLMFKELYSSFNIGIPHQNLKFYYEMNDGNSSISDQFYVPKRSTSYALIEQDKSYSYSKEIFLLDKNIKIDNFKFILKEKTDNENFNSIGLGNANNSFLHQLQNRKYINKRIFSFLFGDDSFAETKIFDGQLLLGCYPHDISPYYDETELNFISLRDKEKWVIEFDYVKYNNQVLKDKLVEFDVNLNLMIGPENFRKILKSSFFREFIEEGKCKENYFKSKKNGNIYLFYSFDNSIQLKEIPNLYFISKELNETFKISFSNLFTKYNQKYYFNIIFNKKPKNKWILGQFFLNEHKFVFDSEEGKIGFYKSNENNYGIFVLIFCAIFFGLIFGLGYLRGYYLKKRDINLVNNEQTFSVRKEYSHNVEQTNTINEKTINEIKENSYNKEKKD